MESFRNEAQMPAGKALILTLGMAKLQIIASA